jgi:hypothetical protein
MRPSANQIQEKLSRLNWRTYRLSAKLMAWAILLERQSKCDGFTELEGLGISLQQYGELLRKTSHLLDEIELDLEALFNESITSKGDRK